MGKFLQYFPSLALSSRQSWEMICHAQVEYGGWNTWFLLKLVVLGAVKVYN